MQPQVVHLLPGTVIAGKFRVLRLLGIGGMGVVYEIEHELTKHRRALKLLHSQFCAYPAAVTRFLREASAAGRIGNAHIVETFDAGQLDTGEPYIVMEQLEGETLADRLGRETELPVAAIADIVVQACVGVQAAHERGIIHRDLKPENIFIERRDGKPFVRILDFGVSKFDTALTGGLGLTGEGLALGTPFYMPPEQIRGEKNVDARSDVYALGVILYEAVTGRRPYEADTLPHLAVLIHEGNAAPIETLRPDLPEAFRDLVHRAMALEPDARFASARALGDALAPFTSGEASLAGVGSGVLSDVASEMRSGPGSELRSDAGGESPAGAPAPARNTLQSPNAPRAPSSAVVAPVAVGSSVAAGTPMEQSAPVLQEKPRSRVAALVAGAIVAAAGIAAWQWTGTRRAALPATHGSTEVILTPSAFALSPVLDAGQPAAPPMATPLAASAVSSRPVPAAVPVKTNAVSHSVPRTEPRPASRAEQKGLANENPFR